MALETPTLAISPRDLELGAELERARRKVQRLERRLQAEPYGDACGDGEHELVGKSAGQTFGA